MKLHLIISVVTAIITAIISKVVYNNKLRKKDQQITEQQEKICEHANRITQLNRQLQQEINSKQKNEKLLNEAYHSIEMLKTVRANLNTQYYSVKANYEKILCANSELKSELKLEHDHYIKDLDEVKGSLERVKKANEELRAKCRTVQDNYDRISIINMDLKSQLDYYTKLEENRASELKRLFDENIEFFPYLAGVMADYLTYDIEILAKKLEWGTSVERAKKVSSIRNIRAEAKSRIEEAKLAVYQLNYLLQLYPSLEDVLDTGFSELSFTNREIPDYDPIRKFLSKEEWLSMSESERNQKALDNYITSHNKSKWQIGRDYELFNGHLYEKSGYKVEFFGENKGLEDLGRDLICQNEEETLVAQCKYWGQEKLIHEKHIFQLYGTTITYCLEHNVEMDYVRPVFITNIHLSDMAKKVAQQLGVEVIENRAMGDFPRIKCNIGRDEYGDRTKIYHLPMDQQYDSVRMDKDGAIWASTVKEAERLGFRRAYKWHGN